EEDALMAGLDRVKGPHWAQILQMFGPGGTINETLKNRNQVQLKDKARNLKLFFLKNGIEVPYYLKFVTGELRTRAPLQAAKQEARERERMRGGDEFAMPGPADGLDPPKPNVQSSSIASDAQYGSGTVSQLGIQPTQVTLQSG
ncbi:TTAGGG repeat binding factor, partial [Ascosphaera acerosa]